MTTPVRQNERLRLHAALLLAGAWAFALCIIFAAHELGHLLALRLYDVTEVRIVLHPFTGARTIWNATNDFLGVVDAAGPLASIIVGVGISAALWRWRQPRLLPLLMLAPVACLTEGLSNFMQIAFHMPGSDAVRIAAAGVSAWAIAALSLAVFAAGLVLLMLLFPLLGLTPADRFTDRAAVLITGLGAFSLIGVVYGLLVDGQALSRNGPQLIFAGLMAVLLAAVYPTAQGWLGRVGHIGPVTVSGSASRLALGLAVVAVGAQFVLFN